MKSKKMTHQELLSKVEFKDLHQLTTKEFVIENTLTLPWLISSLLLAYNGYYLLALPFSGFYFLTGLRQVHNGFHYALGISKFWTWFCLYWNSILMISSIHAIKFNHLRHHKYCLSEDDYEGKSASMTWYQAILYGPKHAFLIHKIALQLGSRGYQKKILLELFSILIFVSIILYWQIPFLMYHLTVMIFGEFLMSFFAVWMVHHHTHEQPDFARTQRSTWKNKISYNMFYHLEHHLFPSVPTIKLPELAQRIDRAAPNLSKKITF